ncbi:MAG: hypothetical protein AAF990_11250 [Bacteroidota bacterium]
MIKSKLVEILNVLDKQEHARLRLYINSPYCFQHPQKEKIQQLLQLIQQQVGEENPASLAKEVIFKQLFPNENMVKGKLEKLMSVLLNAIRQFLVSEENQRDTSVRPQLLLASYFQRKGLETAFYHQLRKARNLQSKPQAQSQQYHYHSFRIEQVAAHHMSHYNSRVNHLNILDSLKAFDIYQCAVKLEYYCTLLAQTYNDSSLQSDLKKEEIEQLETHILERNLLEEPSIALYYHALQLLKKDTETTFQELRQLLEVHQDILTDDNRKALSAICRNFCVRRYNSGQEAYLQILYDLYLTHLKNGDLYHENCLLASTFRNLVTMGLHLKQYDWVNQFIQDHQHRITGTRHPHEVYQLNLANYYFALARYEEALKHLPDQQGDLYYKLATKRLELKIYYETKSPLLSSRIDAFKVYIFRLSKKQLPNIPRRGNNHFIDVLRQIQMPRTYRNNTRIDKLIQKLEAKKIILEKSWLIEKLQALRQ